MPDRTTIVPPALSGAYDNWHFAPAVIARGLIFCSGIIGTSVDGEPPRRTVAGEPAGATGALEGARSTTGNADAALAALVAVHDPEAQFATAFEALDAILAEAGASLADVIEITTYHVDIARHMAAFMQVKNRFLKAPYPAWTAIGVSELIVPGGLMEIRAVALAPAGVS